MDRHKALLQQCRFYSRKDLWSAGPLLQEMGKLNVHLQTGMSIGKRMNRKVSPVPVDGNAGVTRQRLENAKQIGAVSSLE